MKILILLSVIFTGFVMPVIVYINDPSLGSRLVLAFSIFWITIVPVLFFLWKIVEDRENRME